MNSTRASVDSLPIYTRDSLKNQFGNEVTIEEISRLSEIDLSKIPGIGEKSLRNIKETLLKSCGTTLSDVNRPEVMEYLIDRKRAADKCRARDREACRSPEDRASRTISVIRRGVRRFGTQIENAFPKGLDVTVSFKYEHEGRTVTVSETFGACPIDEMNNLEA